MEFFLLDPHCYFVKGAKRGAIYDLLKGQLLWADEELAEVLELCEQRRPLAEVNGLAVRAGGLREGMTQLQLMGLGRFYQSAICPVVEKVKPPITKRQSRQSDDGHRRLSVLHVELTAVCNWDCVFCDPDRLSVRMSSPCGSCKRWPVDAKELSVSAWSKIIGQGARAGADTVVIHGGEPTLRMDDLCSVLETALRQDYTEVAVLLNGTSIAGNERLLGLLVDPRVYVQLQIPSCRADVFGEICSVPDGLSVVRAALQAFKERAVRIRVSVPIVAKNDDHVDETVEWCDAFELEQVVTRVVRPLPSGPNAVVSSEAFGGLLRSSLPDPVLQIELPNSKTNIGHMGGSLPEVGDQRERFATRFFALCQGHGCYEGRISISSTGDVLPCPMTRTRRIGRVDESGLGGVLAAIDSIDMYWNLTKDRIEECSRCELRYCCSDCRPLVECATGRFFAKDPACLYDPLSGTARSQERWGGGRSTR